MKKKIIPTQNPTMDDLRAIKLGTSVTYTVGERKELHSIRNRSSWLNNYEPELGKRYSCSVNLKMKQITVTANPINK